VPGEKQDEGQGLAILLVSLAFIAVTGVFVFVSVCGAMLAMDGHFIGLFFLLPSLGVLLQIYRAWGRYSQGTEQRMSRPRGGATGPPSRGPLR
jgi:hypothetical protein